MKLVRIRLKELELSLRFFDDLSDELCRDADMAEFVRLAHPDVKMAKAAEVTCSQFQSWL
jgi:hypothetical protein